MIVAIVGPDAALASALAANLAVLRRRAGARVLLADSGRRRTCQDWLVARAAAHLRPRPRVLALAGGGFADRLARAQVHYDDVLIDAGDCGAHDGRCALIAAHVALVPLAPADADPARHYDLIARLNAARMFNPGLHVLFVAVADEAAAGASETVRGYAAEVMSGHVAAQALPAELARNGLDAAGRCLCDDRGGAAPWLDALARAVFRAAPARRRFGWVPGAAHACAPVPGGAA